MPPLVPWKDTGASCDFGARATSRVAHLEWRNALPGASSPKWEAIPRKASGPDPSWVLQRQSPDHIQWSDFLQGHRAMHLEAQRVKQRLRQDAPGSRCPRNISTHCSHLDSPSQGCCRTECVRKSTRANQQHHHHHHHHHRHHCDHHFHHRYSCHQCLRHERNA